jgi:hypothetical protein
MQQEEEEFEFIEEEFDDDKENQITAVKPSK